MFITKFTRTNNNLRLFLTSADMLWLLITIRPYHQWYFNNPLGEYRPPPPPNWDTTHTPPTQCNFFCFFLFFNVNLRFAHVYTPQTIDYNPPPHFQIPRNNIAHHNYRLADHSQWKTYIVWRCLIDDVKFSTNCTPIYRWQCFLQYLILVSGRGLHPPSSTRYTPSC